MFRLGSQGTAIDVEIMHNSYIRYMCQSIDDDVKKNFKVLKQSFYLDMMFLSWRLNKIYLNDEGILY